LKPPPARRLRRTTTLHLLHDTTLSNKSLYILLPPVFVAHYPRIQEVPVAGQVASMFGGKQALPPAVDYAA
jgi:hypothetical protein